jgi:hypothetical protein
VHREIVPATMFASVQVQNRCDPVGTEEAHSS